MAPQPFPHPAGGLGLGVVLLGFLSGLGLGAPAFGWSVDRLGTYTPGWLATVVLFVAGTIIAGTQPSPKD